DPGRQGVLADPDLAERVLRLGVPVVDEPEGAAGVAPQVEPVAELVTQVREVGAEDHQVQVLVATSHTGERLEGLAADDAAGRREADHQLLRLARAEHLPGPVDPEELEVLLVGLPHGQHHISSRATTARWSVPATLMAVVSSARTASSTSTWSTCSS